MLLQAGVRQRVAVIVNRNARGVRPRILEELAQLVPASDLFISRHLDHGRQIAATVVERGYDTVLFGGGDGTFVQCLSDVAAESRRRARELPRVGVLRLGTGNALADALGASPADADGLAHDLGRARRPRRDARPLSLLEVDGRLTPFAGCGLDAQILDDFARSNRAIDRFIGPLKGSLGAAPRYAISVGVRSVPRFLLSPLAEIEVVNTGDLALPINWRDGRIRDEAPIPKGAVIWRGRAALASCSTIPNFGLGMKVFPFAYAREGYFQMRFATASAYEALRNLPAVFRGEYRSPSLADFMCTSVEFRMSRPVAVQIGGDLQDGARRKLRVAIARETVHTYA